MKANTTLAKKLLFMLLAMLMPLWASAEAVNIDGIWYNLITKGNVAEVTKPGDGTYYEGAITIPSTVTYEDVEYGVTSIGDEAFYFCTNLTSITILESLTSIGDLAFGLCSSLSSINIPEGVTSIGNSAFQNCI